ncbi:MAG: hypothetical protein LBU40_02875 [Methanobrevibacter sp.]|jgi:nonsense-mediated mRNA decay protein 3|nr:hypothetical protein [Methanobrevibacter sp.]
MFCPECGESEGELIEGICKKCFLKKFKIFNIPKEIRVTVCPHCNAKYSEGKWIDSNIDETEIIYRALEGAIEVDSIVENEEIILGIDQIRGTIAESIVEAKANVFGEEIDQIEKVDVRLINNPCPNCSKKNSGYYEAVIQLRADKRDLTHDELKSADIIISKNLNSFFKKDKLAYLSQKDKLKEGIDYYIGSLKSAKKLSLAIKEELGGIIKESPRLISEDKSTGKGLYRVWISLRLPIFKKHDFIKYNNKVVQVQSFDGKKIMAVDLNTNEKIAILWKNYDSIEFLKEKEEINNTTVISKSPTKLQILDPETYDVVDIDINKKINEKYDNYNIDEEISVVKINGILYTV